MIISTLCFIAAICIVPIKNKNLDRILTMIASLLLIFLFAYNNKSPDQHAYLVLYTNNDYFETEKGYLFLTNIFYKGLKLDYSLFKISISVILLLLLSYRFKKYNLLGTRLVLLMWLLTSYCFDTEQSRFTISACIVLIGTGFLEKKGILSLFAYILTVLLAIMIHTSSVFYLVLILMRVKEKRLKTPIFIYFLFCIIVGLFKINLSFVGDFLYIFIIPICKGNSFLWNTPHWALTIIVF